MYKYLSKLNSKIWIIHSENGQRHKQFTEEECIWQIAHEKCSTSLGIKEMQIKTNMAYYYTPLKMAKITKIMTPPNFGKDAENWITHTLLVKI